MTRRTLVLASAIVLLTAAGPSVNGAELQVLAATPMKGVVQDLGRQFERATGHKLGSRFVSGPIVKREIEAGGRFDLAISITPVIDALIAAGKLVAASRADIGYATVGLGVRAGAPKPDIGTVEAFKQTLLRANSVAHSATGASGDHFKSILQKLGIAEQMQGKLRPMPADTIAQAVPSGQAEMIVVTASVILASESELVGPIPAELQFYNTFAGAVVAGAAEPEPAQAFMRSITGQGAAQTLAKHGMVPGLPK